MKHEYLRYKKQSMENKKPILLNLSGTMHKDLKKLSIKERKTMSSYIRELLQDFLITQYETNLKATIKNGKDK